MAYQTRVVNPRRKKAKTASATKRKKWIAALVHERSGKILLTSRVRWARKSDAMQYINRRKGRSGYPAAGKWVAIDLNKDPSAGKMRNKPMSKATKRNKPSSRAAATKAFWGSEEAKEALGVPKSQARKNALRRALRKKKGAPLTTLERQALRRLAASPKSSSKAKTKATAQLKAEAKFAKVLPKKRTAKKKGPERFAKVVPKKRASKKKTSKKKAAGFTKSDAVRLVKLQQAGGAALTAAQKRDFDRLQDKKRASGLVYDEVYRMAGYVKARGGGFRPKGAGSKRTSKKKTAKRSAKPQISAAKARKLISSLRKTCDQAEKILESGSSTKSSQDKMARVTKKMKDQVISVSACKLASKRYEDTKCGRYPKGYKGPKGPKLMGKWSKKTGWSGKIPSINDKAFWG